jgi:hypothetical protein
MWISSGDTEDIKTDSKKAQQNDQRRFNLNCSNV